MVRADDEFAPDQYEEYELDNYERRGLRDIRTKATNGYSTNEEELLRGHLDYLENLQSKITEILHTEKARGYVNQTLQHDFEKIMSTIRTCNSELDRIDS